MSGPGKRAMVDRRQPVILTPTSQAYPLHFLKRTVRSCQVEPSHRRQMSISTTIFLKGAASCAFLEGTVHGRILHHPGCMKLQTKLTWDKQSSRLVLHFLQKSHIISLKQKMLEQVIRLTNNYKTYQSNSVYIEIKKHTCKHW